MKIKILGAHHRESLNTRCSCLVIDGVLALDAGSLTSGITFDEQRDLKAVLLTHQHYDHIRDIPALAINYFFAFESTIDVYTTPPVIDAINNHLLNGDLYPKFTEYPPEKPAVRLHTIEAGGEYDIDGYRVTVIPVHHSVPTVGLHVKSPEGSTVFYTSDTGPGLAEAWNRVSPDLLFIEMTMPDRFWQDVARSGHLTPVLLEAELRTLQDIRGKLPKIVTLHMDATHEEEMKQEIKAVEHALGTTITFGHERMEIVI